MVNFTKFRYTTYFNLKDLKLTTQKNSEFSANFFNAHPEQYVKLESLDVQQNRFKQITYKNTIIIYRKYYGKYEMHAYHNSKDGFVKTFRIMKTLQDCYDAIYDLNIAITKSVVTTDLNKVKKLFNN